jgi:Flp pilus assembly protein TadG
MIKGQAQSGVAAIELALILAPLLTLCFAGLELGLALQRYHMLHRSAVTAARFLSLSQPGDAVANQVAQCIVLTGSAAMQDGNCQSMPIIPNTSLLNVSTCDVVNCPSSQHWTLTAGQEISMVTIQTQGMVMTDFPEWMGALVFPDIHISMAQIPS